MLRTCTGTVQCTQCKQCNNNHRERCGLGQMRYILPTPGPGTMDNRLDILIGRLVNLLDVIICLNDDSYRGMHFCKSMG
jgi:hypothetical protein